MKIITEEMRFRKRLCEFALKYGPKAYDLLAKGIKKIGPAAEYLGPAAFNRLLSTDYGDIEKALRAGEDVDQKTIDKMIKEAVAKEKEKFKSQSEKGTSKSDTLSVLKPAKADTTKAAVDHSTTGLAAAHIKIDSLMPSSPDGLISFKIIN